MQRRTAERLRYVYDLLTVRFNPPETGLTSEATPANVCVTFMLLASLRRIGWVQSRGIGRLILNLDLAYQGRYAQYCPFYTFLYVLNESYL